ncbi:MAG: asparaginyl/glutamyl-tRNA amidotransferase subunit C [Candidatus Aramenus sulfurataquae]|jgi:aspartyl-tRNA(Asn)/glutamyl-tRNA(Gln) amidotransferase subunit C|uniref:Aspartyl/glutamyl-tRNA(Asn/Gln) amidotransferase subunit C n=2 Tax=Candidatus Aramenus sulfurataquae TaxID=1326980 RepID=W7KWN0_9CREN|nr:MAG: asparaginyl/glutamyl-tRNA amidotransferase subunit C [Candidatus Aramenus sulfurataquae]MBW9140384.1 Asp-tRNA(Asn) amidotransferase subunit GatC [Candidatus Aramenus sp.]MCL7344087.1 Asp-tRNA(Asn) amidotransferase subunit GatC [Candidatus Aramenus sulfurataquae]
MSDLVDKLQRLSLIDLKEEEKERIGRDVQKILQFFNKINELDLSNVEPLFHPISQGKLRKDVAQSSLTQGEALSNVKRKENGFIVGPSTYGD